MTPNLIGSLVAAGAPFLACAITIDTEMILNTKTKTDKIAIFFILLLLSIIGLWL
jgi:hypothetical protein